MSKENPEKIYLSGKVTTSNNLNIRSNPNTTATLLSVAPKGVQLAYDGYSPEGENIKGNSKWYFTSEGSWFWSGGTEENIDTAKMNWGIPLLHINKLWNIAQGEGIRIAVLDTGIDLTNSDLKDAVVDRWNFVSNNADVQDYDGHGTNCSGVIAARGINKVFGVAPRSSLLAAKIMDNAYGAGFTIEKLVNAIQWAADKNASIISMSLEMDEDYPQVKKIIEDIYREKNIIFVAAVGNAGQLNKEINVYPACYPDCISIGAMDSSLNRYKTSNLSKYLSLLAPGVNLLTTSLNNEIKYCTDSSIATAFTSGTFALISDYLARKNMPMDKKDFVKGFLDTATDCGTVTGRDVESGYGIINPVGFLSKIKKVEYEN